MDSDSKISAFVNLVMKENIANFPFAQMEALSVGQFANASRVSKENAASTRTVGMENGWRG